jgi:hypothetical protein
MADTYIGVLQSALFPSAPSSNVSSQHTREIHSILHSDSLSHFRDTHTGKQRTSTPSTTLTHIRDSEVTSLCELCDGSGYAHDRRTHPHNHMPSTGGLHGHASTPDGRSLSAALGNYLCHRLIRSPGSVKALSCSCSRVAVRLLKDLRMISRWCRKPSMR